MGFALLIGFDSVIHIERFRADLESPPNMAMKTASSPRSNGERTPSGSQSKTESTKRPQIVRGNLHDEVVTVLRDMIIQDELQPGTRIPESAPTIPCGDLVRQDRLFSCFPPEGYALPAPAVQG